MAIELDPITLACGWHDDCEPPVAFAREQFEHGRWWPACSKAVEYFEQSPHAIYDVVYLDPSRQRRPNPNHHNQPTTNLRTPIKHYLLDPDRTP